MKIGVIFPQTETTPDPIAVRDYAQAVEHMGFVYLSAYDHVLGANPDRPDRLQGPYTYRDPFHEVLVLFGFLAAVTERLELATGVLVLPQRQTALVAKQAAEVDVLSNGRLRLGVGIGWNHVEYEALGEDFHTRGRRVEEQIEVLRLLWTNELVTFEGRWHRIRDAGINPLPVQRPIPIWMGGMAEPVLRRVARLADGWIPLFRPGPRARATLDRLRRYIREAGRDPQSVGLEGRLRLGDFAPTEWADQVAAWQELGATHLAIHTMNMGLSWPEGHIRVLETFKHHVEERGLDNLEWHKST